VVGEPEETVRRLTTWRRTGGCWVPGPQQGGGGAGASVGGWREREDLAAAESCTGGLISKLLTDIAGSSDYFLGGVVSYDNSAKTRFLAVSEQTLSERGAVSSETALEMARGARERFGSDLAVAVTGIAGPDGGTPAKPVGTVFFAVAGGDSEIHKKREFLGDRATVRQAAAQFALELVRRSVERG
jgi:nicotinamide-nucleotide amidase